MELNSNIKKWAYAILYSLLVGTVGLGIPIIISFLLFGLSGVNQTMVNANNMLMGLVGGPIIFLLTKKYYQKQVQNLEELDLFTLNGIKKSLLGGVIGIILPSTLFILIILCGGSVTFNSSTNWISICTGISTFVGMAILEECIFRGILRSAFKIYGDFLSIVIPTILFVGMHTDLWINFKFLYLIELFFAGILFGVIVIKSESITSAVVAHSLYNILSSIVFGIESNEGITKTVMPIKVLSLPGEQVIKIIFILVQIVLIRFVATKSRKNNSV